MHRRPFFGRVHSSLRAHSQSPPIGVFRLDEFVEAVVLMYDCVQTIQITSRHPSICLLLSIFFLYTTSAHASASVYILTCEIFVPVPDAQVSVAQPVAFTVLFYLPYVYLLS